MACADYPHKCKKHKTGGSQSRPAGPKARSYPQTSQNKNHQRHGSSDRQLSKKERKDRRKKERKKEGKKEEREGGIEGGSKGGKMKDCFI
jgi:hypothetical protein